MARFHALQPMSHHLPRAHTLFQGDEAPESPVDTSICVPRVQARMHHALLLSVYQMLCPLLKNVKAHVVSDVSACWGLSLPLYKQRLSKEADQAETRPVSSRQMPKSHVRR